jgi:hypothetical protein
MPPTAWLSGMLLAGRVDEDGVDDGLEIDLFVAMRG